MSQNDSNDSKVAEPVQSNVANEAEASVKRLRSILLQAERDEIKLLQQQINELEFRLTDPTTRAAETSEILTKATKLSHKNDDGYSMILKPIVVEQFETSSRENPEIMAEALFPILGPAIRKMIASMLSLDKKKTKRTYKFEQLFLIDKETGLPICHATSDAAETQDADMVSGMLSAIQSFVQDAFKTQEFDGLNTLQLGELSVWIEWGPSAVVAAVIRGVAPEKCRTALQELLEDIHQDYSVQLEAYEGDASPFEPIQPDFELFMDNHDSRFINRVRNMSKKKRFYSAATAVVGVLLLLSFVYNVFDDMRWNSFVAELDEISGIVVTHSERSDGGYLVRGLRDPMSASPELLLLESNLNPDKVVFELEPYQALNNDFIMRRIQSVLMPPNGVKLTLVGSELVIEGSTSKSWTADAKRLARQFSEVSYVTVLP